MSLRASLLLIVFATGCASNRWVELAVHDAREVVTAPARAAPRTWKRAAVVTGAVLAATAVDEEVRDIARDNRTPRGDDISEAVTPFGGRYSDRVLAGFLAAGLIGRNDRAKAVAFDAYVSSVVASKVVTPLLKQAFGRDRPNESEGAFEFEGGSAFPSNHATQAFTVASVVAWHYDSPWVDGTAYGLATLVAAARIYDDVHWLSDVLAGAAIGTVTGRFIAGTNDRYRARWMVMPVYDAQRRGVVVVVRR
ncbi:MAG TPA: phosphatase PAP2 family protein [Thermoanaerobaculia bacterium]|nr:phosphatase PAP2 family protein [Thermoanaerobaculia bacterium]